MASMDVEASQRTHRILIVEDDFLIALDEADALRRAGHKVVGIAERCRTAIELAASEQPDLVLMDVRLAGKRDGVETARIIRERCDIPSLFVSAQTDPHVRARAQAAQPAGWLNKPIDMRELNAAVTRALKALEAHRPPKQQDN